MGQGAQNLFGKSHVSRMREINVGPVHSTAGYCTCRQMAEFPGSVAHRTPHPHWPLSSTTRTSPLTSVGQVTPKGECIRKMVLSLEQAQK